MAPTTFCLKFMEKVKEAPDQRVLAVKRGDQYVYWTWREYYELVIKFAKTLIAMKCTRRKCVNIIGFNAPEWVIAFFGAMFADLVSCGVYTTNAPDACLYVADHSEAEVIVCENQIQMKKYIDILDKLPNVKAIVLWDGSLPAAVSTDPRFFTWDQFLNFGHGIADTIVMERVESQRPGKCCNIVYTSGTTGMPKGVMLSHDNMIFGGHMIFRDLLAGVGGETDDERIVSYLPLSHVAAQAMDVVNVFESGVNVCIYFARPDALQGSLVETLQEVRPTFFLAVPRVYEKIEEKMKGIAMQNGAVATAIAGWAKGLGY